MNEKRLIDLCCKKDPVVLTITGSAGAGKSLLMADIKNNLEKLGFYCYYGKYEGDNYSLVVCKEKPNE